MHIPKRTVSFISAAKNVGTKLAEKGTETHVNTGMKMGVKGRRTNVPISTKKPRTQKGDTGAAVEVLKVEEVIEAEAKIKEAEAEVIWHGSRSRIESQSSYRSTNRSVVSERSRNRSVSEGTCRSEENN